MVVRYAGENEIRLQSVFSDSSSGVGNAMSGKYQFQMIFKGTACTRFTALQGTLHQLEEGFWIVNTRLGKVAQFFTKQMFFQCAKQDFFPVSLAPVIQRVLSCVGLVLQYFCRAYRQRDHPFL